MSAASKLLFRAVGDICPGDKDILGLGVCSATKKRGVSFPFARIASGLAGADILVGNLEGILSKRVDALTRPDITFCGESAFASELRRLGFTGVTVANNHVLEHGEAYFSETVGLLRDAGLDVFGLRDKSGEFLCKPVVIERGGRSVGVLAYNWVSVDLFPAAEREIAQVHDGIVNYTWNRDAERDRSRQLRVAEGNAGVLADIRRLKPSVDHLVVIPHWGYEFVNVPPFGCTLEGRSFIEAGADLVVGTHPHVVQGYERHPHGTVFYSLGNFLFDQRERECRRGAVLTYSLGGPGHGDWRLDFTTQSTSCQISPAGPRDTELAARAVASSCAAIASPDNERTLDDDTVYAGFERRYRRKKLRAIGTHLYLAVRYPFVALVVAVKIRGLGHLIARRLRGDRTRW
jgi:poly-gamma-glutamate capsule biosynthesis protein CapA/YwtB (metallophosphatase superfamily)